MTTLNLPSGYRKVPYSPAGPDRPALNYLIPELGSPATAILKETLNGDEVVAEAMDVPCAWHTRAIRVVEVTNGVAVVNDPSVMVPVFDEIQGIARRRVITMRLPAEDVQDVRHWQSQGFFVSPQSLKAWIPIMEAMIDAGLSQDVVGTKHRGWVTFPGVERPYYLYGDQVLAPPGAPEVVAVARSTGSAASQGVAKAGTFQDSAAVLLLFLHNPAFAALAGFACSAPMLAILEGMEPGLINLVGASGCGKTTMLQGIASLIGCPHRPTTAGAYISSWRTTDNGLEGPLSAKSDGPVLLDEAHQAPAQTDWQALLYMIANGRGKTRASKTLTERPAATWRVQVLSSGEEGLCSKVRASNRGKGDTPGGLQFRVIDLNAQDARLWQDVEEESKLPGGGRYSTLGLVCQSTGRVHVRQIVEEFERRIIANHGHVWPLLIESLRNPAFVADLQEYYDDTRRRLENSCSETTSLIVKRRSKHLAASLTGLLALSQILGASDSTILANAEDWAIKHLWHANIDQVEGDEAGTIVEAVEEHLMTNPARIMDPCDDRRLSDQWGWRNADGSVFLPTNRGLKPLSAALGLDAHRVRSALTAAGWVPMQARAPQAGRGGKPLRGFKSPPALFEPVAPLPDGFGATSAPTQDLDGPPAKQMPF